EMNELNPIEEEALQDPYCLYGYFNGYSNPDGIRNPVEFHRTDLLKKLFDIAGEPHPAGLQAAGAIYELPEADLQNVLKKAAAKLDLS
ncbi:MAG TPA: hypothetical protein VIF12_05205, partial [Micavibrio sp.]